MGSMSSPVQDVLLDLCDLNAGMPEQLLHGVDVAARLDHVRGEGVAEGVRALGSSISAS